MKKIQIVLTIIIFSYLCINSNTIVAAENKTITHVVMVWLQEPGNLQQRSAFIKASEQLNNSPGVISRHVGVVVPSERGVVDDTFDVAVSVTLKNKKALQAYLNDSRHKKILKEKIKPLVNRVVIYDFMSQ